MSLIKCIKNAIMIGSTEIGTIRKADMFAVIKNMLYFCSAFETQMHKLEY